MEQSKIDKVNSSKVKIEQEYKGTQFYKKEIQKAIDEGRIENIEPYEYIMIEKKLPINEKPIAENVILDGKNVDIYRIKIECTDGDNKYKLYLHIKE
ncbi:MAG: hypothetical protein WC839_01375 [Candidatus Paceibacterota bacterium]